MLSRPTLESAVSGLYDVAVVQGKTQSPSRMMAFGEYVVSELAARGVVGAKTEQTVRGGGRSKAWDVAWEYDGRHRLAVSLKSILKNLAGTVPNRIDDLMGEAANAQLHSPEIVVGYAMVIDTASDAFSAKHGCSFSEPLRARLSALAGRRPPAWTIGTVEAFAYVEVDFSAGPRIVSGEREMAAFFDTLVEQARSRNPNAFRA